jgi:hypothetical protein
MFIPFWKNRRGRPLVSPVSVDKLPYAASTRGETTLGNKERAVFLTGILEISLFSVTELARSRYVVIFCDNLLLEPWLSYVAE